MALMVLAALGLARGTAAEEGIAFTPPKPGTVAEYRLTSRVHTDSRVVTQIILWTTTVLADRAPHEGVAAYRLRNAYRILRQGQPDRTNTEIIVRRLKDGNELATLDARGRLIKNIEPHGGTYLWPARPGRRWSMKTVRRTIRTGRTKALETAYRIAGIEDAAFPAGRFKSVRIEGQAGPNGTGGTMTFWFIPSLGLEGRWRMTQNLTTKFGEETVRKVDFEIVLLKITRP